MPMRTDHHPIAELPAAHPMRQALAEAAAAAALGEVPVGAVLVQNGRLLALAHNRVETDRDPPSFRER